MQIITNHQWRPFVQGYELTEKERDDFDYMSEDEKDCAEFFRYRGRVYSLDQFMRIDEQSPLYNLGFDGYHGDSYFSGILIRLSDCGECYKVATYIS